MKRWFRQVLPPVWTIALFVFLYAGLEVLFWLALRGPRNYAPPPEARFPRDVLLRGAAVLYGVFRVAAFHPALRESYRKWLLQTPWTSAKPLPVGPVHLAPQDGLVVLLLTCLGWPQHALNPVVTPLLFSIAYLAVLTITFWSARAWVFCYGLPFGIGLIVFLVGHLPAQMAIAVVLCLFGTVGLRRALADLPRDARYYDAPAWLVLLSGYAVQYRRYACGWPFAVLRPNPPEAGIGYGHGACISLLTAWWTFAVLSILIEQMVLAEFHADMEVAEEIQQQVQIPDEAGIRIREDLVRQARQGAEAEAASRFAAGLILMGAALSIGRLSKYCAGHHSPISLWGRICTLRWVIPRYDRVVLAPILTLLVPLVCLNLAARQHVPLVLAASAAVALMLLISLNMGPRLIDWQLTGGCRIVPPSPQKNKRAFVQI